MNDQRQQAARHDLRALTRTALELWDLCAQEGRDVSDVPREYLLALDLSYAPTPSESTEISLDGLWLKVERWLDRGTALTHYTCEKCHHYSAYGAWRRLVIAIHWYEHEIFMRPHVSHYAAQDVLDLLTHVLATARGVWLYFVSPIDRQSEIYDRARSIYDRHHEEVARELAAVSSEETAEYFRVRPDVVDQ